MDELDVTIFDNIAEELYDRGYGIERLGSVNIASEWMTIALVAIGLYLVWGSG